MSTFLKSLFLLLNSLDIPLFQVNFVIFGGFMKKNLDRNFLDERIYSHECLI